MSFEGSSSEGFSCDFCNERLPTVDDKRIHLEECASKTEQCSRCQKYISRSIFAYHTANSCTNPYLFDEVTEKRFDSNKHRNEIVLLGFSGNNAIRIYP